MLAVSRRLNPELEHIEGDMRSLRLGREFDVVFLHDAVMCMTSEDDLLLAIATAHAHARPGGVVLILLDFPRETWLRLLGEAGFEARALPPLLFLVQTDQRFDVLFQGVHLVSGPVAGARQVGLETVVVIAVDAAEKLNRGHAKAERKPTEQAERRVVAAPFDLRQVWRCAPGHFRKHLAVHPS
jgi:hypothetical protein